MNRPGSGRSASSGSNWSRRCARGPLPVLLLAVGALCMMTLWQMRTCEHGGGGGSGVGAVSAGAARALHLPAGGAPAGSDWLAAKLLPLTNFSAIGTADLLALAGGGSSAEDKRGLVRLHQGMHCSIDPPDPPGSLRSRFANVSLVVYADNDIVSNNLNGAAKAWEAGEVREMFYAMRAPVPTTRADLRATDRWRAAEQPFVVDVGANVGWFSFNAAAAGGKVAAFEAMSSNVALLRASLCANPWLMDRIALYATGLGTKDSTCYVISDVANQGDGHTICDQDPHSVIREWKMETSRDYQVRGMMTTMRLDELIDADVQFMKIDVEGFEREVLTGAKHLLERRNVWFVAAECNPEIIGADGVDEYIRFLDARGYYISSFGFQGPFLRRADIRSGRARLADIVVYCVRRALVDAIGGPERASQAAAAAFAAAAADAAVRGGRGSDSGAPGVEVVLGAREQGTAAWAGSSGGGNNGGRALAAQPWLMGSEAGGSGGGAVESGGRRRALSAVMPRRSEHGGGGSRRSGGEGVALIHRPAWAEWLDAAAVAGVK